MAPNRLSRFRAASLILSGALVFMAVILVISSAASLAQDTFTVSVSLYTDAGPRGVKVPVTLSGSSVSGSKTWNDGTAKHTLHLSGTLEKGLDGKPRIIADVKDDWYRPSSGKGDPGT
jgi:hypothetical protein